MATAEHAQKWGRGTHYSHSAHSWLIWHGVTLRGFEVGDPEDCDTSKWDGSFGGEYFDCVGEDGSIVKTLWEPSEWIAETLPEATLALEREYQLAVRFMIQQGGVLNIPVPDWLSPNDQPLPGVLTRQRSPNDPRDEWLYEKDCEGLPAEEIIGQFIPLCEKNDWTVLEEWKDIRKATDRYAKRHGLDPPPRRQQFRQ